MVSSGLAFVSLAITPTYCATKAAMHSYTQSLRLQLTGTTTEVMELIPPYVQTQLMGKHQEEDPHAMPLKEFLDEVMLILTNQPSAMEICVEQVKPLRYGSEGGNFENFTYPAALDKTEQIRYPRWRAHCDNSSRIL